MAYSCGLPAIKTAAGQSGEENSEAVMNRPAAD